MKVLIIACLVVVAVSANLEEQGAKFQAFKLKHSKTYLNQAEEAKRFAIFNDNLRSIEEHNALYEQGLVSYKQGQPHIEPSIAQHSLAEYNRGKLFPNSASVGINKFTDMTRDEFRAMLALSASSRPRFNATTHVKTGLAVPESVDWRSQGQVTGVKDQGDCGSCWAFSVTGSTEAAYYRKSGALVSLSEQQLVDCSTDINDGCDGGYMDATFPYVQEYGLQTEASYPYTGRDDSCKYSAAQVVTKVSSYNSITAEDEDALLDAVANIGPVSVAMDATYLFLYDSGIYEDNWCSTDELNHGVLVVGYGVENNKKFWIVKNSWGTSFGESGYFRIARGQNECGIAEDTVYPTV